MFQNAFALRGLRHRAGFCCISAVLDEELECMHVNVSAMQAPKYCHWMCTRTERAL